MTEPSTQSRSKQLQLKNKLQLYYRNAPRAALDQGIPFTDFHHMDSDPSAVPHKAIVRGTKGDGKVTAFELKAHFWKDLEGEFFSPRLPRRPLAAYIANNPGLKSLVPPWIIRNRKMVRRLHWGIVYLKNKLRRGKFKHRKDTDTPAFKAAFNRALAKEIITWAVLPKRKGGLGIRPANIVSRQVLQERTVEQILGGSTRTKGHHCTESAYVMYALFTMAKLKPHFTLVYQNYEGTKSLNHYCISIQLDSRSQKRTLVDLSHKDRRQWLGTPHKSSVSVERSYMFSMYENNKGARLFNQYLLTGKIASAKKKKIRRHLERAKELHSYNPFVITNLAGYYVHFRPQGFEETAKGLIGQALKLFPDYLQANKLMKRLEKSLKNIPRSSHSIIGR